MRRYGGLLMVCALAACHESDTREERMAQFRTSLGQMDCPALSAEKNYLQQIRNGIHARQENEITPADIPATVLMLGINGGMNASNRNERNDRMAEMEEKIQLTSVSQQLKGCPL